MPLDLPLNLPSGLPPLGWSANWPLHLSSLLKPGVMQRFQDHFPAAALPPLQAGMTLFCDFDGPIVDVSSRYYDTYRIALARTRRQFVAQGRSLQLTPLGKAQFWRMKQARSPDVKIALRSGLSDGQAAVFLAQVKQLVNHYPALLRRDVPQPQVPLALDLLRQQDITLVLVTLRCEAQVHDFLQKHQMSSAFAAVYGTQNTEAAYQNYTDVKTSLLSRALEEQGGSSVQWGLPHACWMVGDTEADVVAAQRLGIPAIALTCGIRSSAYLKRLKPDAIQSNLLTLAQAARAIR